MKKSLLFGAAALMALSANAQTMTGITKVWEHSFKDHSTVETRSIGCIGDKALVPNNATQELEVWGANGMESSYKIGEWLTTNDIKLNPEDAAPLVMGRGVSVDEAGNIITNLNFPSVNSSRLFLAIKPSGEMTYIPCEFPADVVVPEGAARCDFLGDKTAGDVFGNAFIITTPDKMNDAIVFNIYEGEQDLSYTYKVKIGDEENAEVWNTESSAIPLAALDADAEQAPKFIARNRSIGGFRVSDGKSNLEKKTYVDGGSIEWGAATCTNFTAFVVGGKEYAVVNQQDLNGYKDDGTPVYVRTHSWEVFDLETAQSIARWTMPAGEAVNYMVGFASSVNEDGTVNIFQFNPGIRLAMYKIDVAGVEDAIADDVNAPVKYYNLQGVEIANPENGLFIKKQGAKATKVVL
ncbi:MAG: hypothetical protein ACI31B_06115 [Muribaculaceae bacterium]